MQVQIISGNKIRTFGGWYRHDRVIVDGQELFGFVQVRRRNKRTEATTCFHLRSCCVLGSDVQWLLRMNREHWQEIKEKQFVKVVLDELPAA